MTAHEELWAEWDRADWQMSQSHCAALILRGVPPSVILGTPIGVERITTDDTLYHPEEDGLGAIIQPVFEWEHPGPNLDENGYLRSEPPPEPELILVDLIAWKPTQPDRWCFRRSEPALVLGAENIEDAINDKTPLCLHLTPLGWLQSNCAGACIVNPKHAQSKFAAVETVYCETLEQGRWFDDWMREDWLRESEPPFPTVHVPNPSPKEERHDRNDSPA